MLSIGSKSPGWVQTGYEDYSRRLKGGLNLTLEEIPAPKHHADQNKIKAQDILNRAKFVFQQQKCSTLHYCSTQLENN